MIPLSRTAVVAAWTIGLVSLALFVFAILVESPVLPWISYALWGALALGLLVRLLDPRRKAGASVDPMKEAHDIYLGRRPPTPFERQTDDTSHIGQAPDSDPLQIPTAPSDDVSTRARARQRGRT